MSCNAFVNAKIRLHYYTDTNTNTNTMLVFLSFWYPFSLGRSNMSVLTFDCCQPVIYDGSKRTYGYGTIFNLKISKWNINFFGKNQLNPQPSIFYQTGLNLLKQNPPELFLNFSKNYKIGPWIFIYTKLVPREEKWVSHLRMTNRITHLIVFQKYKYQFDFLKKFQNLI